MTVFSGGNYWDCPKTFDQVDCCKSIRMRDICVKSCTESVSAWQSCCTNFLPPKRELECQITPVCTSTWQLGESTLWCIRTFDILNLRMQCGLNDWWWTLRSVRCQKQWLRPEIVALEGGKYVCIFWKISSCGSRVTTSYLFPFSGKSPTVVVM